jgi:hypothetical protein
VLICAQRPDENKKIKRVYVTFWVTRVLRSGK